MSNTRLLAAVTTAAMLAIPAAHAADLPPLPPPVYAPPPPITSGWYLRGDIGMTNQSLGSLNNVVSSDTTVDTKFLTFDASPLFGVGVGYQWNNWLRFDVTAEYRSNAHFHGQQVASAPGIILPDDYHASKNEALFLANAYVDLGTWWCVTPFIGAGVGGSYNTIKSFTDIGATQAFGNTILATTYGADASKWSFAWAIHAGLAYQVTPNFTVELAYRYVNLGDATTGPTNSFDGVTIVNGSAFQFKDLTSSDVKLGVRWMFDTPPPPPLMRKG
jgi:opacity protein-like surface antigen